MSRTYLKSLLIGSVCLTLGIATPVQTQQLANEDADSFTSENAILDTSILFAIGAREARQELRGSFGWPTFQEGLVEGVYFRFDPDGYARFSPSPRLDADVFEIICRPRTYSCMGRKNGLAVALTSRGTLQLRLENVVESDQFFVADGISELPLPQNILQPLDPRLELLLSSGGELVVKRREAEAERVSLVGFSTVAAYLRWISARQDYVVLPRGWPVPNSNATAAGIGLTQAANWQSPMPQPLIPQAVPDVAGGASQNQISEIAETSKEAFALLKEMAEPMPMRYETPVPLGGTMDQSLLLSLKASIDLLLGQLEQHGNCTPTSHAIPKTQDALAMMENPEGQSNNANEESMKTDVSLSERLQFLIEEIGLPADLALIVAQQDQATEDSVQDGSEDVVSDILEELKSQLEIEGSKPETSDSKVEYQLLSEYFKSVSQ